MKIFIEAWENLGEKWQESFLQLPPEFSPNETGSLRTWLEDWPRELPLQVEFRHPEWFVDRQLRAEIRSVLEARGIGALITDTPGRRDVSHGTLTCDRLCVRFLAQSGPSETALLAEDEQRIATWSKRIAGLFSRNLKDCAVFVHTPDLHWVPEISRIFEATIAGEAQFYGVPLNAKVPVEEVARPIQGSLFSAGKV